jgi:HPt (histidine-containing phosphotransfer) domain-containing protein
MTSQRVLLWYEACFCQVRGQSEAKPPTSPRPTGRRLVSSLGPIDGEALAQLRRLAGSRGASLADDAIDAFGRELPARLRVLREALAQSDWRSAEHGAQALRGIAATLGARDVVAASEELTEALASGATDGASTLLGRLEAASTAALAALELERTPSP